LVRKENKLPQLRQEKTGSPDSSEDEGCKARIRMSYFVCVDASLPKDDSAPSGARENDEE